MAVTHTAVGVVYLSSVIAYFIFCWRKTQKTFDEGLDLIRINAIPCGYYIDHLDKW